MGNKSSSETIKRAVFSDQYVLLLFPTKCCCNFFECKLSSKYHIPCKLQIQSIRNDCFYEFTIGIREAAKWWRWLLYI